MSELDPSKVMLVKIQRPVRHAPCGLGGKVIETDPDNKNGECNCFFRRCLVNGRNEILEENWHEGWMLWPVK